MTEIERRERERDDLDICSNAGETRWSRGRRRVSVLSNVQTTSCYYLYKNTNAMLGARY